MLTAMVWVGTSAIWSFVAVLSEMAPERRARTDDTFWHLFQVMLLALAVLATLRLNGVAP